MSLSSLGCAKLTFLNNQLQILQKEHKRLVQLETELNEKEEQLKEKAEALSEKELDFTEKQTLLKAEIETSYAKLLKMLDV